MWEEERLQRQQIKFDFGELDEQELGRLERTPTPYPKEMKHRIQHMRNLALKELNVGNGEVKGRSPEKPRVSKEVERFTKMAKYKIVDKGSH